MGSGVGVQNQFGPTTSLESFPSSGFRIVFPDSKALAIALRGVFQRRAVERNFSGWSADAIIRHLSSQVFESSPRVLLIDRILEACMTCELETQENDSETESE